MIERTCEGFFLFFRSLLLPHMEWTILIITQCLEWECLNFAVYNPSFHWRKKRRRTLDWGCFVLSPLIYTCFWLDPSSDNWLALILAEFSTVQRVKAAFPSALQFVGLQLGLKTPNEKVSFSTTTRTTTATGRTWFWHREQPSTHKSCFLCSPTTTSLPALPKLRPKVATTPPTTSIYFLSMQKTGLKRIPSVITFCMHFLAIPNSHII